MFKTIFVAVAVIGLLFGGGTVTAAQSSLPDEALYPVKIWSEDSLLSLTGGEQSQFELTLDFVQRRFEEIQSLVQKEKIAPEMVLDRLETQMEDALVLAANMPDDQAKTALFQVQTQLQMHQQAMLAWKYQTEVTPPYTEMRMRVENTLELHLGLAKGGADDPQWLRIQLRDRDQKQNRTQPNGQGSSGDPWTTGTPSSGNGYGPGQPGDSQNPWTTGTPTPGSGYGPGEPGESQNPWTTGTPTPGSGYGPGPGTDPDFTPVGNGPGPCESCGSENNGNGNKP